MKLTDYQNAVFEWDDNKQRSNLAKHGIDFLEAMVALNDPHLEFEIIRNNEIRVLALCQQTQQVIAIVYVNRNEKHRIISARKASRRERRLYREHFDGRGH